MSALRLQVSKVNTTVFVGKDAYKAFTGLFECLAACRERKKNMTEKGCLLRDVEAGMRCDPLKTKSERALPTPHLHLMSQSSILLAR